MFPLALLAGKSTKYPCTVSVKRKLSRSTSNRQMGYGGTYIRSIRIDSVELGACGLDWGLHNFLISKTWEHP